MLARQADENIFAIPGIESLETYRDTLPNIYTIIVCLFKCGIFNNVDARTNAARFKELLNSLEGSPEALVQEAAQIYVMISDVLPLSYYQYWNMLRNIVEKNLCLKDFVELKNLFGNYRWNATLVKNIVDNTRSIMEIVHLPNFDIDKLHGVITDKSIDKHDLHSFLNVIAHSGCEKYMTQSLSSRLIQHYSDAKEIIQLLDYLYERFGDGFSNYIDDVFSERITLDNVMFVRNKAEEIALDKLKILCDLLDEALASTKTAYPNKKEKYLAEDKISEFSLGSDFFIHEDEIASADINRTCEKLEKLRTETIYLRTLDKISSGEESISPEELAYFALITDQPELINLYDLQKCTHGSFDSALEIVVGLRARKDKHFSTYEAGMLDEAMEAHHKNHEKQPLFATRLCRKLDHFRAKLRDEPYYHSLIDKVDKQEHLSDEESLYFSILTDDVVLRSNARLYDARAYTSSLDRIENEKLRQAIKQKINMIISLRGYTHSFSGEDHNLMAKMRERGARGIDGTGAVAFLNLENVDLSGIDLIGNNFLIFVNLKGAKLEYAQLDQASLVNFSRAHMRGAGIYSRVNNDKRWTTTWKKCNFNEADLSESTIKKPHLSNCTFVKTNFERANIHLSKLSNHNDADFTAANFNSATMINFNACPHGVKQASVVWANLINSMGIFHTPENIDELFSFTDVETLNWELTRLEQWFLAYADKEKYLGNIYFCRETQTLTLKEDIRLAAARHIIKRVMTSADKDLSQHRDMIDAACAHSIFQPESKAGRVANDVITFASSKIHGWFSEGVDTTRPLLSTPALNILIPARDKLRVRAASTIYL